MKIRCVWEHNGNDTLLYSDNFIGAYTRGRSKDIALEKMQGEVESYLRWQNELIPDSLVPEIVQQKESQLQICDADSDIIFDEEKKPLTKEEYLRLKELALKSASDFLKLYEMIPDKNKSVLPKRKTFYGDAPRTAYEMYEHTKNVNSYYFGEINTQVDNKGTIYTCRKKGFELLEQNSNYLINQLVESSYDEFWSLRKVLRRFIWHDRIHAKAMYKMAIKTFGYNSVENVFKFNT
ncbi:hypothetical protein [Lachnoclostridium phytofermentans]|uniref:Uncharacterized protein n=1 Tax=Lachnoclostridium phytofermentans (strain ATCC 700394 / DSM 18823 / ISDg) TaxID=357809 RepID=A9KPF7_LACP7|nr:hypothetical protein [Lachnoclostridium phytofermentans]ABX43231.1 conserved hypothetical protein [Lachnoclostridium phytofermentans ISDg]